MTALKFIGHAVLFLATHPAVHAAFRDAGKAAARELIRHAQHHLKRTNLS
jgi:hypothetical protein